MICRNTMLEPIWRLKRRRWQRRRSGGPIPGIQSETTEDDGITITQLHVQNEQGSQAIGKMQGHYVTIEVPGLRNGDTGLQDRVATQFAKHFEAFLERLVH